MKLITVKMPDLYVELLDELVKEGFYTSRSDAIRQAVIALLRYHGKLPNIYRERKAENPWRLDNRARV